MHEFFGISTALLILALANELGGTDAAMKTELAPRPVLIVAGR